MNIRTKKIIGLVVMAGLAWAGVEVVCLLVRWSVYQFNAVV